MAKNANFNRKKQRALKIMAEKGMWRSNYAPPLHRLLWKLGVNMPPPPFTSFWTNVLLFGSSFGLTWGIFMWFSVWQAQCASLITVLISAALAGLFFALISVVNRKPQITRLEYAIHEVGKIDVADDFVFIFGCENQ